MTLMARPGDHGSQRPSNLGLWPQSAATLDALLCMQIKGCLPSSNSNPQLKPTAIIMSAIAKNWEAIADNLSKAGWSYGYAQPLILTGEQSGLQTHIAATKSVSLCVRMKS